MLSPSRVPSYSSLLARFSSPLFRRTSLNIPPLQLRAWNKPETKGLSRPQPDMLRDSHEIWFLRLIPTVLHRVNTWFRSCGCIFAIVKVVFYETSKKKKKKNQRNKPESIQYQLEIHHLGMFALLALSPSFFWRTHLDRTSSPRTSQ